MRRFAGWFVVMSAVLTLVLPTWGEDKTRVYLDKEFLIRAAGDGNAEVKLGELAEGRAVNERVKQFARQMVTDHTKANHELAQHARNQKVAVLSGLEKEKREVYDQLARQTGPEFDRAYMKTMVDDHKKAIKLFEAQAKQGTDGDLKKFAETTLPVLREHLKMAEEISVTLK